jgi:predicted esterase
VLIDPRVPQVQEGAAKPWALLLVHGRGGSAADILALGEELRRRPVGSRPETLVLAAPQAVGNSWYPNSFLAPLEANEPHVSSALAALRSVADTLGQRGIRRSRQVLVGFSQGACLASELVAREGGGWGGLLALTGGVLGPLGVPWQGSAGTESPGAPAGDLQGTPVLLSSGDPDPHVPFSRVRETASLFEQRGARVEVDRYPGRPHTVVAAEVERAATWLKDLLEV